MPAFAFPEAPAAVARGIRRRWNAPLPIHYWIPRLRHRTYARLLSTRRRSTSELLRTL